MTMRATHVHLRGVTRTSSVGRIYEYTPWIKTRMQGKVSVGRDARRLA